MNSWFNALNADLAEINEEWHCSFGKIHASLKNPKRRGLHEDRVPIVVDGNRDWKPVVVQCLPT